MEKSALNAAPLPEPAARKGSPATRAQLLDAALAVLDRKSIFDVTVDDFVCEAGVARGTFYIYFRDKYAILAALAERVNADVFEHAYAAIDYGLPPFERLRASLASIFAIWRRHGGLLRSVFQLALVRPDFLDLQRHLRAPFIERAQHELQQSIDRGHARPIDSAVAARALAALMDWFCLLRFGLGDAPTPDRSDDYMVDQLALLWYRAVFGADPPVR